MLGGAFQTLVRSFGFLLRPKKLSEVLKRSAEYLKSLDECLKGFIVCFKANSQSRFSSKKISENLVCKKHRIYIGI